MAKVQNGRKIAENFNRLSRVHERYRQTDRQIDDRRNGDIANVNVNSRSLKTFHSRPCGSLAGMLYRVYVLKTRRCKIKYKQKVLRKLKTCADCAIANVNRVRLRELRGAC